MRHSKISLKEAIKFHGHLGPYLVLGILAGEVALSLLKFNKYFGFDVKVTGMHKKPRSCFIDGLQLSTGATYGKGNIKKIKGNKIKVYFCDLKNKKMAEISFKDDLVNKLDNLKGHNDSETFAKRLYKTNPLKIFILRTYSL